MKNMLKKFQSEEGFDLVQVLVTVAILAVIATIAVLALIGQLSKGDNAAAKSNVNQAITAAQIDLTEGGDGTSAAAEADAVGGVTAVNNAGTIEIESDDVPAIGAEINSANGTITRIGSW